MKKEPKKGWCEKCGEYFYVNDHHILPKGVFGKGETIRLCVKCHAHIHAYMDMNVKDTKNKDEVKKVWYYWFKKVAVIVTPVIILALIIGYFLL